jgi:2-C-methyl-D-erythritol 4-phosphate cytidylyltransferase/2-C-methyl-D-erythritol 2,4-cyclodiphosphate synthase
MDAALSSGAAVPVVHVRDTVKRVSSGSEVLSTVPRDELRLSQTPQGFSLDRLITVLEGAKEVTDEAAAMESAGVRVTAVRGDALNMKLTYPEDLGLIASLLPGEMETRSGLGLDFHPFQEGRDLRLAGCLIDGYSGLAGHSDGDTVLHAAADALLAASRLGDIGVHFPPGDPEWKDADSSEILRRTWAMVREAGWALSQMDITVMAEFPPIAQLRDRMIRSIASILQVREDLIWIKGTTTNTLGDIGRGRGLGCMVLAMLRRSANREPRSGGDS